MCCADGGRAPHLLAERAAGAFHGKHGPLPPPLRLLRLELAGLPNCLHLLGAASCLTATILVPHSCQISAHIPLERLASTFLAGLLHLAHTSGNGEPYVAALQAALSGSSEMQAAETAARQWQMCGLAAERITAWMSQVGQGVARFGLLQHRAVDCLRLQRCCQFLLCS